jgi:hypothetical protein
MPLGISPAGRTEAILLLEEDAILEAMDPDILI